MAWYDEAIFYHIYPLGLTGAPKENSYGEPEHRLNTLLPWISHIKAIGCNAIYIGPLFESTIADALYVMPNPPEPRIFSIVYGLSPLCNIVPIFSSIINYIYISNFTNLDKRYKETKFYYLS